MGCFGHLHIHALCACTQLYLLCCALACMLPFLISAKGVLMLGGTFDAVSGYTPTTAGHNNLQSPIAVPAGPSKGERTLNTSPSPAAAGKGSTCCCCTHGCFLVAVVCKRTKLVLGANAGHKVHIMLRQLVAMAAAAAPACVVAVPVVIYLHALIPSTHIHSRIGQQARLHYCSWSITKGTCTCRWIAAWLQFKILPGISRDFCCSAGSAV